MRNDVHLWGDEETHAQVPCVFDRDGERTGTSGKGRVRIRDETSQCLCFSCVARRLFSGTVPGKAGSRAEGTPTGPTGSDLKLLYTILPSLNSNIGEPNTTA